MGPFRSNCTRFSLNSIGATKNYVQFRVSPYADTQTFYSTFRNGGRLTRLRVLRGGLAEASHPNRRLQQPDSRAVVPEREGELQSVEIRNLTKDSEVVHWHGLYLPPDIDGAMEKGTPMIAPGASTRYTMTPMPAGFRWYHTH